MLLYFYKLTWRVRRQPAAPAVPGSEMKHPTGIHTELRFVNETDVSASHWGYISCTPNKDIGYFNLG